MVICIVQTAYIELSPLRSRPPKPRVFVVFVGGWYHTRKSHIWNSNFRLLRPNSLCRMLENPLQKCEDSSFYLLGSLRLHSCIQFYHIISFHIIFPADHPSRNILILTLNPSLQGLVHAAPYPLGFHPLIRLSQSKLRKSQFHRLRSAWL